MAGYSCWAKVVENADPDGLNRVKVQMAEEEGCNVTDWIPVVSPYASGDAGLSFLPDIGDQALVVSFDAENAQKAVVGAIWSDGARPPETKENTAADLNKDGKNTLKFFRSKTGNRLIFDDTEGGEKIQLLAADGKTRLEISAADKSLSLAAEHDITIGAKGTLSILAEEVEISSESEVSISADKYQVQADSGYSNNAGDGVSIEGSGIALN